MATFNINEIFEFAIKIEKNGYDFYNNLQSKTDNSEIQLFFSGLAIAELEHSKLFYGMLSEIEQYEPPEVYTNEYFLYLHSYMNNAIFDENKISEVLDENKFNKLELAVEFAMNKESESILFYHEIKPLVNADQKKTIDKIINEERKHYMDLAKFKLNLNKKNDSN